ITPVMTRMMRETMTFVLTAANLDLRAALKRSNPISKSVKSIDECDREIGVRVYKRSMTMKSRNIFLLFLL
ncbi:MAG: hypothetical protein J6P60_05410, partial [Lachnospiraceae bacterium]|nr:hypothetical protein [Lachnospiraceae bacterium]